VTDDADADTTANAGATRTPRSDRPVGSVDGDRPDGVNGREDAASEEASPRGGTREPPEAVDFEDLSLPQRVFVAAVQNPTRGVFLLVLLAFAFSFYIAFWMVFPRVAAFLTALAVVLAALLFGIYYVLDGLF